MTRLIAAVAILCAGAAWAAGPPDREAWERFGKVMEARRVERQGLALYRSGRFGDAAKVFATVLAARERLYSAERYPLGHPELALSLNNLAAMHLADGDSRKAKLLHLRALGMRERLYPRTDFPRGHPDVAESLINLASLYRAEGDWARAMSSSGRASTMYETLYPRSHYPFGHPNLAASLTMSAALYQEAGDFTRAAPLRSRALLMYEGLYPKSRYPKGHPALAIAIENMGGLHFDQGDYARAGPLLARALEMREGLFPKSVYPQGHPDLAHSLSNLGGLYRRQGDFDKALPLCSRALEMREGLYPKRLYPQGHPSLARDQNQLGSLYQARGDYAKAEPLFSRALAMREKLYPKDRFPTGHPELATSLNNAAVLYQMRKEYAKAEPLFIRALEMTELHYPKDRYPQGHSDLASSINNLAGIYYSIGEYVKAEPLLARALAMNEALYPKGRYPKGVPELAQSLDNLATLYRAQSRFAIAAPLYARALKMYGGSSTSLAAATPEATASNYLASQPPVRDSYLSTTLHLPRIEAYPSVWRSKAALAQIYERRHLAVLAASSKPAKELWDAVLSLRRERELLLLAPTLAADTTERAARIDEIDKSINKKEGELLPLLPALKRSDDLAQATPGDLRKALPVDAAFIDLLLYTRFEQVPKDKVEKRTPHYVAFVVTRASITRVELGEAGPIEEALDLWRRSLVESSPAEPKYAAEVYRLLWSPLAKRLPAKTSAVFVSPDAALNRLPWAALRDPRTDRVLIEDYAVATVPHGPMLLDRLTGEKRKAPAKPTLLAMGGVAYDEKPGAAAGSATRGPAGDAVVWSPLAGTAKELRQLAALAGGRNLIRREGGEADAASLLADLPKADAAHLATHGFFADAKFRTAFQLDPKLFERLGSERGTAGARSPMVLSGLVCAGANVEGTPNRGVVTADAIVGLDLRRLDLAVLSACETGLGDVAGGEGVYGLVRAFHVAGTRNVVASLWKVDDGATAALMALFYRNLWGKEKVTPMEALRRAQLAVYRDPGRVPEWAAGRGPLPGAVAGPKAAKEKGPRAKTSPARAWAAFVISGPGD